MNLTTDPWVPVVRDGATCEVSLLDALVDAHQFDGLALDDPLQAVAVLRQVLLPVCLDIFGVPTSAQAWERRWRTGRFDEEALRGYLSEHASRFDLFGPDAPFGQVAGLRTTKDEVKPVSLLLPALPSGNNVPLFAPVTEASHLTLTPAEAIRALLAVQCFDTAAIKSGAAGDPQASAGKTTGNPTSPVGQLGVVVPLGHTLYETLTLNTPVVPQGLATGDAPQWRRPPATAEWSKEKVVTGLLDLLTFQARRIRLVRQPDSGLVCGVVLTAGDRLGATPEIEPHTRWRHDKPRANSTVAMRRPLRHSPGRAPWEGLTSLLSLQDPPIDADTSTSTLLRQLAGLLECHALSDDYPLQLFSVGVVYGNQSAVVEDVLVDLMPLPLLALTPESPARSLLENCARQAAIMRRTGNALTNDLRAATGGAPIDRDKGAPAGDRLVRLLDRPARRLLTVLQQHPDEIEAAALAWRREARRLCLDALDLELAGASPQAFLGRRPNEKYLVCASTAELRFRKIVNDEFPRELDDLGGSI